jgi:TIR domain
MLAKERMMAAKVFISYRRDDSAGQAGRIQDRLEREFGHDLLFMDVDAIPLGTNFVKVLHEEVAKCGVLLAVIGPNWPDVRDEAGNRRLDNPKDFVRIEIAAALQRDIPVIPILLDGARIPKAAQPPKDLEELPLRNGLDVRHASFPYDMDKLIRGLKGQLGHAAAPPASPLPPEDHRKIEEGEGSPRLTEVDAYAGAMKAALGRELMESPPAATAAALGAVLGDLAKFQQMVANADDDALAQLESDLLRPAARQHGRAMSWRWLAMR